MIAVRAFALIALLCAPLSRAEAGSEMHLTGGALLHACTIPDKEWISFCNGYIQAAFDATGGKGMCVPISTTRNQLFDVIIPTLTSTPALQELDAISAIEALLRKAYPCG